jgi:cytochrome c biogenesis protein CcdA
MQLFLTTKDSTMKGNFAAIVLIVLGAAFLLNNLGLLNFSLTEVLRVWWPVVLIAVGAALFLMPRDKTDDSPKR